MFTFLACMLLSAALFTGCKKEGCTDRDSVNYDADADKDDGSCKYEGEVVFWYDQSTSTFLQDDQAYTLTYYVDGQVVGSSATSVYWTGAPDCGQNGSVTVTKDLGTDKSKSYSYKVIDQTGWEYWSGTVTFSANTCIKQELHN